MKNKKLVYILLPMAVFVWGLVIYRIVTFTNQDDELILPGKTGIPELNDSVYSTDFTIVANYRDPFRRTMIHSASENKREKERTEESRTARRKRTIKRVRWPGIEYNGIVENAERNETIAILNIDNKNCLLKTGDEKYAIRVLKIYKDSVRIKYEEEEKTLNKVKD